MTRKSLYKVFTLFLFLSILCASCQTPMAEGKLYDMEPVSRIFSSNANTLYYAVKWAMAQNGYPLGIEDLDGGVIESKWVPTGAGSHYVDLFDGKDYGTTGAYFKMIVRIQPLTDGRCKVIAKTKVNAFVNNMKSSGEKEMDMLASIAIGYRSDNIKTTNLGVEE